MLPLPRGRCVVSILVVPINNGGLNASRQHSACPPGTSVSAPADSDEYLSAYEFPNSSVVFTEHPHDEVCLSESGSVYCVLSGGVYYHAVDATESASSAHPEHVYVRWRPVLDRSGGPGCGSSCHLLRPLHTHGSPRLNRVRGGQDNGLRPNDIRVYHRISCSRSMCHRNLCTSKACTKSNPSIRRSMSAWIL